MFTLCKAFQTVTASAENEFWISDLTEIVVLDSGFGFTALTPDTLDMLDWELRELGYRI